MKLPKFLALTFLTALFPFLAVQNIEAQTDTSSFDAHALWDPLFYPHYGNQYRSGNGAPGPDYWQNSADYKISATLDTAARKLTGKVVITYTNNSPDELHFLWLQLDQNAGEKDSRSTLTAPKGLQFIVDGQFTRGFELHSVHLKRHKKSVKANYVVTDTRMQIRLKKPLKAQGGKIKIEIAYSFEIPKFGTRMGWVNTKNGMIYDMAQWYPRMAVYDDAQGWNNLPYLGLGEFYLEYGDFDYTVTVPANMIVWGSGELMNPKKVLTSRERKRLRKARKSDETVYIQKPEEITHSDRPQKGIRTWHFKMNHTRDVVWTASKAFVWDAARVNLPNGKKALAQTLYPVESPWEHSTEYIKACLEFYSHRLGFSYPYPAATAVAASWGGGMEYPGMVFDAMGASGHELWFLTIHEFGHTWFPMIVGSNERRYMWMDEGLNTFINYECSKWYKDGKFYRDKDWHKSAGSLFYEKQQPTMTVSDAIKLRNLNPSAYGKPALALQLLRDDILGKERFDYAFHTYIEHWAYKHPTPWDFFRTMENASGENLDWFWREWILKKDRLDQAVKNVDYKKGNPANGSLITLENNGKMAMPVAMKIKEKNQPDTLLKLPVEIWQRGPLYTVDYPSTDSIRAIILDPNHRLPDMKPANNVWNAQTNKPLPKGLTGKRVLEEYIKAIGGKKKLNSIKDYQEIATGTVRGVSVQMTKKFKAPDKFLSSLRVPAMNNKVVQKVLVNGDHISMQNQQGKQKLSAAQKSQIKRQAHLFPDLYYLKNNYKLELKGYGLINGDLVYKVEIQGPEATIVEYFDPKTHFKRRTVKRASGSTTTYKNYKEVDGIWQPFSSENSTMGIQWKVDHLKINKGISDSDFE